MTRPIVKHLLSQATAHAEARAWEPACEEFSRLARFLESAREMESACGAWGSAGDAAWRADRPLEASLVGQPGGASPALSIAALRMVQISSVLMETGKLARAEKTLARIDEMPVGQGIATLQRDTRIGLLLLQGRVTEARREHLSLAEQAPPGAEPVVLFRNGQIRRFEGRLQDAEEELARLSADIEGRPEMDGPLGATLLERVELATLRGDETRSLAILEQAEAAWSKAGRASGVYRVEAQRLLLAVRLARGHVLTTRLDQGILFAQERGMVILEAELRLARARCRRWRSAEGAREDLAQVIALTEDAGAVLLAGQARLEMNDQPQGDLPSLERASRELRETSWWYARALLARARLLLSRGERLRARSLAQEAMERFEALDVGDSADAREVLDASR
jgi:hypothetical protein